MHCGAQADVVTTLPYTVEPERAIQHCRIMSWVVGGCLHDQGLDDQASCAAYV